MRYQFRWSHSVTCHPHTNHTCLYFPAARHHHPLAGTHCAYLRKDSQAPTPKYPPNEMLKLLKAFFWFQHPLSDPWNSWTCLDWTYFVIQEQWKGVFCRCSFAAPRAWNWLRTRLKLLHLTASFKTQLKLFLFSTAHHYKCLINDCIMRPHSYCGKCCTRNVFVLHCTVL